MVTVVDLGVGNLASVTKMLTSMGQSVFVTDRPSELRRAHTVILPGVGAFDAAAAPLWKRGIGETLLEGIDNRTTRILGLCLGMHLLLDGSEEGDLPGLGLFGGIATRIPEASGIRIPHVGWNSVNILRESSTSALLPSDAKFYFAHSFTAKLVKPEDASMLVYHGTPLVAAIESERGVGVQFHPEKSHRYGRALLEGFVRQ